MALATRAGTATQAQGGTSEPVRNLGDPGVECPGLRKPTPSARSAGLADPSEPRAAGRHPRMKFGPVRLGPRRKGRRHGSTPHEDRPSEYAHAREGLGTGSSPSRHAPNDPPARLG